MDKDQNDNENGGVPIRKLFVANIPSNAKCDQLKTRFREFGEVQDVFITKKGHKPYAFVTFREESAAKAARVKTVQMNRHKLCIRPADIWHQPDFKDAADLVLDQKVDQNVNGTVLMLNDDCLLKILKYLPALDLLRAEKVCWRFRNVAEMCYKSFKVFDSKDYEQFSVVNLRALLYNIGPYVQTLKVQFQYNSSRSTQRLLRFAALYCTNVTTMQFTGIDVSYKTKNIQNLFRNLTKLEIESCSVADQDLIYLLKASENKTITDVNLSRNFSLSGRCLAQLGTNVKVANLYSCSNIQRIHFIDFLRDNSGLEELNVVMCDTFNGDCIEEIAKLTNLRKLAISNGYTGVTNYSALKSLKSLRHLDIQYVHHGAMDTLLLVLSEAEVPLEILEFSCGPMTKSALTALLSFKTLRVLKLNRKKDCDDEVVRKIATLKTLEEFSIAACHDLTDDGVMELVRLNTNLRFLDVSHCPDLSEELVPALVVMTRTRPHLLTIRVGGSSLFDYYDDADQEIDTNNFKWAENLKLDMASTFSTYLVSSDEASSEEWMDYDYWHDYDEDDDDTSSEVSADSEYAARLLFDILRHGEFGF